MSKSDLIRPSIPVNFVQRSAREGLRPTLGPHSGPLAIVRPQSLQWGRQNAPWLTPRGTLPRRPWRHEASLDRNRPLSEAAGIKSGAATLHGVAATHGVLAARGAAAPRRAKNHGATAPQRRRLRQLRASGARAEHPKTPKPPRDRHERRAPAHEGGARPAPDLTSGPPSSAGPKLARHPPVRRRLLPSWRGMCRERACCPPGSAARGARLLSAMRAIALHRAPTRLVASSANNRSAASVAVAVPAPRCHNSEDRPSTSTDTHHRGVSSAPHRHRDGPRPTRAPPHIDVKSSRIDPVCWPHTDQTSTGGNPQSIGPKSTLN